jgi:hypothetical protein
MSLLLNCSRSCFFSVPDGACMLIIRDPWNVVAFPLPDGRRCMSVMLMPSFAKIAVQLFSTPIFVCCVYRRIEFTFRSVTSCKKAMSI